MEFNAADFNTPYEIVKEVKGNYQRTRTNPRETLSGVIRIEKLRAFMEALNELAEKKNVQSVKIYLFREKLGDLKIYTKADNMGVPPTDADFEKGPKGYTQMSFLIIPHDDWNGMGSDVLNDDGETILVLRPGGETTGLCPPKCGGTN